MADDELEFEFNLDEGLSIDLTGVKDIADGEYHVQITALKGKKFPPSKKNPNGLRAAAMEFTVVEPGEYQGRKLFQNLPLEGAGAYLVKSLLKVLGLATGDEDNVKVTVADILNQVVYAYIRMDKGTTLEDGRTFEPRPRIQRLVAD